MTFWSGETLEARGAAIISDFDKGRIDCNSYRLLMGDEYYCTSDAGRSIWDSSRRKGLNPHEAFIINPGQFGFLITKEILTIPPDAMAFISMRSGVKFRGLINVSGFHVDPGYRGKLVFSVFNAGPSNVHINQGEEVFLIWFASLDKTSEKLRSNTGYTSIPNSLINGMSREVISLSALQAQISEVKVTQRIHTIIFGAFSALFLTTLIGGAVYIWQQGFQLLIRQNAVVSAKSMEQEPAVKSNATGANSTGTPQSKSIPESKSEGKP